MDNLSTHTVDGVRERIEAKGAELIDLPPYSNWENPRLCREAVKV